MSTRTTLMKTGGRIVRAAALMVVLGAALFSALVTTVTWYTMPFDVWMVTMVMSVVMAIALTVATRYGGRIA